MNVNSLNNQNHPYVLMLLFKIEKTNFHDP